MPKRSVGRKSVSSYDLKPEPIKPIKPGSHRCLQCTGPIPIPIVNRAIASGERPAWCCPICRVRAKNRKMLERERRRKNAA